MLPLKLVLGEESSFASPKDPVAYSSSWIPRLWWQYHSLCVCGQTNPPPSWLSPQLPQYLSPSILWKRVIAFRYPVQLTLYLQWCYFSIRLPSWVPSVNDTDFNTSSGMKLTQKQALWDMESSPSRKNFKASIAGSKLTSSPKLNTPFIHTYTTNPFCRVQWNTWASGTSCCWAKLKHTEDQRRLVILHYHPGTLVSDHTWIPKEHMTSYMGSQLTFF